MFDLKALKDVVAPAGIAAPYTKSANGDEIALVGAGYARQVRTAVPVRRHRFADPPSLCAWLKRHAHPELTEILVEQRQVSAIVDGRAIDSDHVTAEMAPHPRFSRWHAVLTKTLTQRQFASLLGIAEDDIFGGNGAKMKTEVAKASWSGTSSVKSEVDARGYVSLQASTGTTAIDCTFPAFFTIKVPRYVGIEIDGSEPLYEIRVYVEIDAAPAGVVFKLTMPDLEIVDLEARRDVVRCAAGLLGEGWIVGVGDADCGHVVVDPEGSAPRARLTNADAHRA